MSSPIDEAWDWTIGVVVAPFGLKGEMRTKVEPDFAERYAGLGAVEMALRDGRRHRCALRRVRMHKGYALITADGIDSIEAAEEWRGAEVRICRSTAAPLPEDGYYVDDLVGMKVVTESGTDLGTVSDILRYPAHDLLKVGDTLIPAVRPIVVRVDRTSHTITVDPPEGLLDQ